MYTVTDLSDYVGIPFKDHGRTKAEGVDCWGLFRLVQEEVFGVVQPTYDRVYATVREREAINNMIQGVVDSAEEWVQIPAEAARVGDAILLYRYREYHVGVVAYPGKMLHVEFAGSVMDNYTSPRFSKQIAGFFRYAGPPEARQVK